MEVKGKLTVTDNWGRLCTGTRDTLLHLSQRSFSNHPSQSLPGRFHLIQAEINTWPLRRALDKQGREKHGPGLQRQSRPLTSRSAQHSKVNELTTFPPTWSNQQQRPPSNVSSLEVAATLQSRRWFTQTHLCRLTGEGTKVCTCMDPSMGSMRACGKAPKSHTCSKAFFSSLFLLQTKEKKTQIRFMDAGKIAQIDWA